MRVVLLSMVICLGGCLASQTSHNPLKKKASVAPVASETPEAAEPEAAPPRILSRVEMMQELFLTQLDMNAQILKLAEGMSPAELKEINEFLAPFGTELTPKKGCDNPNHGHDVPKRRSEAF
jgi:hypothetical protein